MDDDSFSLKLSADGALWRTALVFDPADGTVSGDAVQQHAADPTPGRLMLAQHGVLRSDIVGPVAQSGGLPVGAIIERRTVGTDSIVKWADGTVRMSRRVSVDINATTVQNFAYPASITTVLGGRFHRCRCCASLRQRGGGTVSGVGECCGLDR